MAELTSTDGIPVKSALAVAVSMAVGGYADDAQAQDDGASGGGIEEITVTARKREESLQDVSASIQALTGDDLKRQGLLNIEDVIRKLPSVNHIGGTAGANKIIFRGVSDNPGAFIAASSAALYIDEQPLTQFSINPEPRMVDIERVEALAGPQGTLYGDSSQSGTMRIITNKPDPTAFSAFTDVMFRQGDKSDFSHDVSAMINLPLMEDKFAVRLVGFTATDGGFIDNVPGVSPVLGTKDNSAAAGENINDVDITGGRVRATWFVNEDWSVSAGAILQNTSAGARNDYDPNVGDLQTLKFYRDTRDDDWWQGSLTVRGRIGELDLISITSFFERDIDYIFDRTTYSAYFNVNFCPYYATYCWSGTTRYDQDTVGFNELTQNNQRTTQEFRVSQEGDNFRWTIGAFYEEKSERWEYRAKTPEFLTSLSYYYWTQAFGYTPSGVDPSWWLSVDDTEWDQWAVFGNFTFDFSENFSAEAGIRYFDQNVDRTYFVDKPFIISPAWPDVTNPQGGHDDVVPKISFTYRIDDEKMVYALYSEGFRAGGANRNRTPFTIFPQAYGPDLLTNYEIGFKSLWADNKVQLNATYFLGTWDDYQIEAVDPSNRPCGPGEIPDVDLCGQPFQVMVANVGQAEMEGIEGDIRFVPNDNIDMGLNFTFVNAETTEDFFVTSLVPAGTPLPNVPELKFSTYFEYTTPVESGDLYGRIQYTWQDDSRNQIEDIDFQPGVSGNATYIQPSYGVMDIKVGLANETWTLEGFMSNVTDERAVIYDDPFFFDPFFNAKRVTTNRPREIGVRFAYRWN